MLLLVQGPAYVEAVPVLEEDDGAPPVQDGRATRGVAAHAPQPVVPIPAQPLNPLEQLAYAGTTTPDPEPLVPGENPLPVIARAPEEIERLERSWRGNGFWLFLLMMIPLAWIIFLPGAKLEDRIRRTLKDNPTVAKDYGNDFNEEMPLEEFHEMIDAFPGQRVTGALLGRHSVWHILMALGATALFVWCVTVALPTDVSPKRVFTTALFTGTAGVLLLIAAQLSGAFCCIGAFYLAAEHPDATFGASLIGFVFGVGFLEEAIKCLPVLWKLYRRALISWRASAVIGMASGAGFGISEAILYATQDYNGIEPASMYFVRFLSTVALHVVLSGASAVMIQRKQEHLMEDMDFINWTMTLMAIIFVPIFLHGLYNTLSKKEHELAALAVAIAAFGWLWWQIKSSRTREQQVAVVIAAGPQIVRTAKGTRFIQPPPPIP